MTRNIRGFRLGDYIEFDDGHTYTVVRYWGSGVKLQSDNGAYVDMDLGQISRHIINSPTPSPESINYFDRLPAKDKAAIRLMAAHLEEVRFGTPINGGTPRPEYALNRSQTDRILAKVHQLTLAGMPISEGSLRTKMYAYMGNAGPANPTDARNIDALVDHRVARDFDPLAAIPFQVREAMEKVRRKEEGESTGDEGRFRDRVKTQLKKTYPHEEFTLPSDATLTEWRKRVDPKGNYTLDTAQRRRSKANAPTGMFDSRVAFAPGGEVQIDSSRFDVFVRVGGSEQRAVLAMMMCKPTRTIISTGVFLRGTKGVDHTLLLARALTPPLARAEDRHYSGFDLPEMPWADTILTSGMQYGADLVNADITRFFTRMPFIIPRRIIIDNGKDYRAEVFRSCCERFGIDLTIAPPHSPDWKQVIERTFGIIGKLFAQHLPGYSGNSVANKGNRKWKLEELLTLEELAELFERWVAIVWQNRYHKGLSDPYFKGTKHTPNSIYMALFNATGEIPIPLGRDDYISLLPTANDGGRTIQPAGIEFDGGIYDSTRLNPLRGMRSGEYRTHGLWTVYYDPYDPGVIWIRDPKDKSFIECTRRNGDYASGPFAAEIRKDSKRITDGLGGYISAQARAMIPDLMATSRTAIAARHRAEERADAVFQQRARKGIPEFRTIAPQPAPPGNIPFVEADITADDYLLIEPFDPTRDEI